MNTLGLSLFIPSFRLADDFTVTDPDGLALEEIVLFAYQTGSTLDSTITEFNLRIWDRPPDVPGAKVLFGDDVTNRLTKTSWTGIYRVTETIPGNTLRPIMMNTVAAGVFLEPGTYWFDCQADGTLGSGPFMAPITINGVAETGNAMQYSAATMSWGPARDSTFGQPQQGFPFVLRGRRSHETEILGQRLFDSTGQEIGPDDFRISSMGPDHSLAYSPFAPAIAVRDAVNEYLVVWTGDDTRGSLVDGEFEAFGQRLRGHGETGSTGFTSLNIVYHILGLIPFQTGMDTNMDGDVDASDVVTNENAINP
jgi:hypothetical protein